MLTNLAYDTSSPSCLIWLPGYCKNKHKSMNAGFKRKYWLLRIQGKEYSCHKIIWEMHFGKVPPMLQIDHINGNRYDNKISNLRLATQEQNQANAKKRKDNLSGIKGVCIMQRKGYKVYRAEVMKDKKRSITKSFNFSESGLIEAQEWIYNLRLSLHGDFSNHGY